MVHRIRLRNPWKRATAQDSHGSITFSRQFNLPTNLQPEERVFAELTPAAAYSQDTSTFVVALNEQSLQLEERMVGDFGSNPGVEQAPGLFFHLTPHLAAHNRLEISFPRLRTKPLERDMLPQIEDFVSVQLAIFDSSELPDLGC